MPSLISFKNFMELSLQERKELQQNDFSDWEGFNEDATGNVKKDLKTLEKLLRSKDWWYSMADDGASYRKGREEDEKIKLLMRKIGGDEPKRLWTKYAKKAGVIEAKTAESERNYKCQKREKEEPKNNKQTVDYMNPQNWFPDMDKVKATGSLNMNEAEGRIPKGKFGRSYFNDNKVGWEV